jgi:hypothetical protein
MWNSPYPRYKSVRREPLPVELTHTVSEEHTKVDLSSSFQSTENCKGQDIRSEAESRELHTHTGALPSTYILGRQKLLSVNCQASMNLMIFTQTGVGSGSIPKQPTRRTSKIAISYLTLLASLLIGTAAVLWYLYGNVSEYYLPLGLFVIIATGIVMYFILSKKLVL